VGEPAEKLVETASELGADLVVVGRRDQSAREGRVCSTLRRAAPKGCGKPAGRVSLKTDVPPTESGDAPAQKEVAVKIVETLRFPVQAHWFGGRLVRLGARDKPPLRIAPPPASKDGIDGLWSPEELLVGATAACFELTLVAIAERRGVPVHTLEIDAVGHVERLLGRQGCTSIELDVEVTTDSGREPEVEEVAQLAKERCIVGRALEVPVHVRVGIRTLSLEPVVA
jgi:organic hydroperoxide reductase OsmC/OhrA